MRAVATASTRARPPVRVLALILVTARLNDRDLLRLIMATKRGQAWWPSATAALMLAPPVLAASSLSIWPRPARLHHHRGENLRLVGQLARVGGRARFLR
jgi:hypothetical protein